MTTTMPTAVPTAVPVAAAAAAAVVVVVDDDDDVYDGTTPRIGCIFLLGIMLSRNHVIPKRSYICASG